MVLIFKRISNITTINRTLLCIHIAFVSLLCFSLIVSKVAYSQDYPADNQIPLSVNIEITTHLGDKQQFKDQDEISFFINLDRASYLYAFYQDASGKLYQIMPGKAQAQHYFQPGYFIPFPSENSSFKFIVQAPFGVDTLYMFASDQKIFDFKGKQTDYGDKLLYRSISEISRKIKSTSGKLYGETQMVIHTYSR